MRSIGSVVLIVTVLLGCGVAFAQQNCHDLRALNTQNLGPDGWVLVPGSTRGVLDQQLFSPYYIEYLPGQSAYPSLVAGRYYDYTQVWHFRDKDGNETGTFTVTNYHASFPVPPGKAGMGTFSGTGKITSGTGIFSGATGTVNESGPYLLWFMDDGSVYGLYHGTYVARVCMN